MSTAQMEQLFRCCDTRGTGYLDYEQLRDLCVQLGLDPPEANTILESLDHDGDGKISLQDFSRGFADFLAVPVVDNGKEDDVDTAKQDGRQENALPPVSGTTKNEEISCPADDHLATLYSKLQTCDPPQMTSCFEAIIKELLDNVRHLQEENQQLEQSWKREKVEHERHLLTLEEELDCQVKDVEQKAKKKAEEEMEAEKTSLKRKMSAEMDKLHRQLLLFDKVENWLKSNRHHQEHSKLHELRTKLEQAFQENRQLRMSLIETQTSVTLMRSELVQLRALYEEKCRELDSERGRVLEVMEEQEHLSQQLYRLYDVNRRLQDTNETLWVAAKSSPKEVPKGKTPESERRKRGSVIGDYLSNQDPFARGLDEHAKAELLWNTKQWDGNLQSYPAPDEDLDHCGDDGDSGLYTLKDISEGDDIKEEDEYIDHHQREELSRQREDPVKTKTAADLRKASTSTGSDSTRSTRSLHPTPSPTTEVLTRLQPHPTVDSGPTTQSPDRTYKVVFVGDAAVGKSSFILRLATGTFAQNLNSTVGLDFRMKTLKVDGLTITVQLWDTAGQERFRSITQSYFRKVDGVMVLYDCTCERSFLNIRQWVDSISETAVKKIPVLIVANKCDLRGLPTKQKKAPVESKEGERIAKEFCAPFVEASAKDGSNVLYSLELLCRLMAANEDQDVKSSGLYLDKTPVKKSGRCCGK